MKSRALWFYTKRKADRTLPASLVVVPQGEHEYVVPFCTPRAASDFSYWLQQQRPGLIVRVNKFGSVAAHICANHAQDYPQR